MFLKNPASASAAGFLNTILLCKGFAKKMCHDTTVFLNAISSCKGFSKKTCHNVAMAPGQMPPFFPDFYKILVLSFSYHKFFMCSALSNASVICISLILFANTSSFASDPTIDMDSIIHNTISPMLSESLLHR